MEKLRKKGYEVLYLTEPIDEVAISSLQVGARGGLLLGAGGAGTAVHNGFLRRG